MSEATDKISKASALLSLAAGSINLMIAKRRMVGTKIERAIADATRAVELLQEATGKRKEKAE
jgi:hypothetical protein